MVADPVPMGRVAGHGPAHGHAAVDGAETEVERPRVGLDAGEAARGEGRGRGEVRFAELGGPENLSGSVKFLFS